MANSTSSVSVAMAVYNGEKYLPEQIESILSQLREGDELVISYDESQDNSLAVIKAYAEKCDCINLVYNRDAGVVSNFNNAISNCSNEVIFISDQDDVWVQGKRDAVVSKMAECNADLVIHNGVHIDEEGQVISRPFFSIYKIGNGILRNFLAPRYSGCCMAIRRSALRYLIPMPTTVINYDHWIGMACELFGGIEYMDEVLLKHRLHGNNVTTSRRRLSVVLSQRARLATELLKRRGMV